MSGHLARVVGVAPASHRDAHRERDYARAMARPAEILVRTPNTQSVLWRRGFRPFFLGVGLYAGLAVLAWIAIWRGLLPGLRRADD